MGASGLCLLCLCAGGVEQRAADALRIVAAERLQFGHRAVVDETVGNAQSDDVHGVAVILEKFGDRAACAALDRAVLDGDDRAEAAAEVVEQLLVERFDEKQVDHFCRDAFCGGLFCGLQGILQGGAHGDHGDVGTPAADVALADGQGAGRLVPVGADAAPARIADDERTGGLQGRVHQVAQFGFVARRGDRHAGNRAHEGDVEYAVVRHAVLAHQTGPVEAEDDRQVLDGHVVDHVVVGALHERGVDAAEGNHASGGQTGREGDCMALGNAHVEAAVGQLLLENVHRTARQHGGGHAHDARILAGKFQQRMAEDLLVAGVLRVGRRQALARGGVELARSVPYGRVALGRCVALAFLGDDVQQLGAGNVAYVAEDPDQRAQIVAVHRPEIAEVEAFEQVALAQNALFDEVAEVLDLAAQARNARHGIPDLVLQPVVVTRGGDVEQVFGERAHVGTDRHVVVVEDHEHVGIRGAGVVEPLVGQSAGQGAVADHRHHVAVNALQLVGLGDAQCGRDRHRSVARAEGVVGTLRHAGEPADAVQLAVRMERFAAAGQDLVGIGLMTHVPDDLVLRRVIDVVQGHGQLDGPQARSQVAGVGAQFRDHEVAQLAGQHFEFGQGEFAQVGR